MKKMTKNLLELCLSPDLGGLELYMVRAAKAMEDDFNLISVINENAKIEQYYENTEFKYEKINRKGSFSIFNALKLAKIIDKNQIDTIHMHWTKDIPIAVLAKLFSNQKPKIVQTRNMNMTRFKDDFYHRFLYKNIDKMLAVTYKVKEQIQKYIPQDIRPDVEVLYMGSDKPELLDDEGIKNYRNELGLKDDDFLVTLVGRIEEAKGQHLLIEAMQMLKQENIPAKIFFVGHAMRESYIEELKTKVKEKNLENEVVFYGFTKNPHNFMQASDVVVLATDCETFGLVVIEAMQVGTPALATNQCGPLEMIEHEKSGLLFEKNSSEDIYKQIKKLYENPTLAKEIAETGKLRAEDKFSNTKQFKKLAIILKAI